MVSRCPEYDVEIRAIDKHRSQSSGTPKLTAYE
jgi:hypothetical protein